MLHDKRDKREIFAHRLSTKQHQKSSQCDGFVSYGIMLLIIQRNKCYDSTLESFYLDVMEKYETKNITKLKPELTSHNLLVFSS